MEKNELIKELKNLKLQLMLSKGDISKKEEIERKIEQVRKEYGVKVREEIEKERGNQK